MSLSEIDRSLFFIVNKNLHGSFLDAAMPFITNHSELVFLVLLVWTAVTEKKAILSTLFMALVAVALADGSGHILKDIIARPRPCSTLADISLLVGCGHSYSMPSNHATNAFAFAMTFFLVRRNVIGYLLLAAAVLIGYSRIYVGVHYPFDVIAGAVSGSLTALAVIKIYGYIYRRLIISTGLD